MKRWLVLLVFLALASPASADPRPFVSSLTPASVPVNSDSFILTINGDKFTPTSVVRVNGTNRVTAYISTTQLTAVIPAVDLVSVGTKAVAVYTPPPGGGTSAGVNLAITAIQPPPTPTPGTWKGYPNSTLRPAMSAATGYPLPWNPRYIMDYSGGSYDAARDELIVWGGGHADYPGNEVCRFARATGTWTCGKRSDPGPLNASGVPINTVDALPDGTPAARHTAGSLAWITGTPGWDGFFVHGGSLAGGGYPTYGAWFYHRDTTTWEQMPSTLGLCGQSEYGSTSLFDYAAWDSVRKVVHVQVRGGMRDFDPATRAWTCQGSLSDCTDCELGSAFDPERQTFLLIGKGITFAWDTSTSPWTRKGVTISGDATPVAARAPGLVFDSVGKRYLAYDGGQTVWSIDRDTWVSTALPAVGDNPGPKYPVGTYGRFQFVAKDYGVIVTNDVDGGVFYYQLPPVVTTGNIPPRTWVLLSPPAWNGQYLLNADGTTGNPTITYHDKHVQAAYNPDNGRIYFHAGDYYGASYRNELWSLDVVQRLSSPANPAAGWTLEYPYCGPTTQVQPTGEDYPGWTWDTTRRVFWTVPGEYSPHGQYAARCPGEAPDVYGDQGNLLFAHIMTFDPVAKVWADWGAHHKGGTRSATYDPVTDTLVHPGLNNDMGVFSIATKTWTYYPVSGSSTWSGNIWAADVSGRRIFIVDASQRSLYRWDMDAHTFTLVGSSPCHVLPPETVQSDKGYLVWDSVSKVVIQNCYKGAATYAYRPDTNAWENLSDLPMQGADGGPPQWYTGSYNAGGPGGGVGVVQFNSVTFDPVNSWLVGLGWQGVWLFRYAPATTRNRNLH